MRTLYLCGAGNSEGVRLALRIQELRERWNRIVLLDDDPGTHGREMLGVEVVGPFSMLAEADPATSEAVNLVARTTQGRQGARRRIEGFGVPLAPLLHPEVDTLGARLEGDLTVYAGATIAPEVAMAPGSVVFMGAVVGHESTVGRGCVIASNAVLNARVELGDGVYIGTNATVLPEIRIGAGATVGAGSVVVQDVPSGATVMGVPARTIASPQPQREARPTRVGERSVSPATPAPRGSRLPRADGEQELEKLLTGIWCRVLQRTQVDPTVNFFDLGGTSLAALQVVQQLQEATGQTVDVVSLFQYPTVEALARHLSGGSAAAPRPTPPARTPTVHGDLVSTVADVFEEVLGTRGVGLNASFTELGGTTVEARAACDRLEELTGIALCHMHVERFPTARRLGEYLDTFSPEMPPPCPAAAVVRRQIHHQEFHRHGAA